MDVQKLYDQLGDYLTMLLNESQFEELTASEVFQIAVESVLNDAELLPVVPENQIVGQVDTDNVAFSLENEDVALLKGGLDFAQHIGKTVWNYVDVPPEEGDEDE